ncbi:MAG: cytochrome c [Gammaproteobacteria bacterium]|nr:cytochrome c [Gammaproteobacteria bacterium]
MRRKLRLGVTIGIWMIAGYTHAEVSTARTAEDVMSPDYVGILANQLPDHDSAAAVLYKIYCAQCHRLVAPNKHTASEWAAVITRMRNKIKGLGKTLPNDEEWDDITRYVIENAQK